MTKMAFGGETSLHLLYYMLYKPIVTIIMP